MPGFSSRGVFLSYRREDSAPYARLLQVLLRERFPDADVFMDLDSIEAGLDFAEVILEKVDSCAVLVALIGHQWLTLADEEGHRRLDNPDDWVRFEVQTALERGVRVIPVLVDGARPPRQQQLPAELHKLARLNALELSYSRFQYDADRLLELIQRVLAAAPGTVTVHQPPGATAEILTAPDDVQPDRSIPGQAAQEDPLVVRNDPDRAARLLAEVERLAQSMTGESWRHSALVGVAEALVATDADRAIRLAESITTESKSPTMLADIAKTLAATDPDRAADLLTDAERLARSFTYKSDRARALAGIATALEPIDPDRAARLIASAERLARSNRQKDSVLADIARTLAATDPDPAERIAQSISDESGKDKSEKARVLAYIAKTLAATDPDRAARLLADAERLVQSITTDVPPKASAFAEAATILAVIDPDRTVPFAPSITTDTPWEAGARADIAKALAATDPDRAVHLAESITSESGRARALADIATTLAATDPDRAVRVLADAERLGKEPFTGESWKASARAATARALAATDPDRAIHLAHSVTDESEKADALADIATTLAATDPDRAIRLAHSVTDESRRARALADIATTLAATDPDRAARLLADAERVAKSITEPWNDSALADIATALAPTDPDRAVHLAGSMTDGPEKADALAEIAKILAATLRTARYASPSPSPASPGE